MEYPGGISEEMLDWYANQKQREQRNKYNREHPEKVLQQRIRTSANFLRRHGYIVMANGLPPLPWGELECRAILQALKTNLEENAQ